MMKLIRAIKEIFFPLLKFEYPRMLQCCIQFVCLSAVVGGRDRKREGEREKEVKENYWKEGIQTYLFVTVIAQICFKKQLSHVTNIIWVCLYLNKIKYKT